MATLEIILLLCLLLAANLALFTGCFCYVMVKDYLKKKNGKEKGDADTRD